VLRKRSDRVFGLCVVLDLLFSVAAWNLAYVLRFHVGPALGPAGRWLCALRPGGPPSYAQFIALMPVVLIVNFTALAFVGAYARARARALLRECKLVCRGAVLAWIMLLAVLYCLHPGRYSRPMMFLYLILSACALMLSRYLLYHLLVRMRAQGRGIQRAAIVGTGQLAQATLHRLRGNPWLGTHVACFVDLDGAAGRQGTIHRVPVVPFDDRLAERLRKNEVDAVLVAVPDGERQAAEKVLDAVLRLPVSVALVPEVTSVFAMTSRVVDMDGQPVIQLADTPVHGWHAVAKRTMDVVGASLFMLLVGWWLTGLCAVIVKLTSKGPVFYAQERMGLDGKVFRMFKFRTMRVDAEKDTGPVWAVKNDSRVTRFGGFLRRTCLDELPQFFNVLKGDMSLVGPRPERPVFVERFKEELPAYMLRHHVKAGITGWAQINGLRGDTSLKKRLRYDLYYVNHWTLRFDVFILLMTPFCGYINRDES
jgi:exopolysaccharide biosynthesis polyprenyl glycosylphosphotransferase